MMTKVWPMAVAIEGVGVEARHHPSVATCSPRTMADVEDIQGVVGAEARGKMTPAVVTAAVTMTAEDVGIVRRRWG